MAPFKSILVDVDATASSHPALERAERLAKSCGAKITLCDVLTFPPYARRYLPENVEDDMIRQRRQQLTRLEYSVTGMQVESKLLIGRPGTVLIQEVLRSRHDLLMRSHARDLTAPELKPFGAIDMELVRKCPCPVFLVRYGNPSQHPQIMGAVNASTEENSEQALNRKIVELTLFVAELEKATPILFQAWVPFAEWAVRSYCSEEVVAAYVESTRNRTAADLASLTQSFAGRQTGIQALLRRGEPEDVIPEFAAAQGIDLVVMGTVARSGIAGLLIGNTAERLLRKLPCSVLAVKPDGFVCPVRFDAV